MDNVVDLASRKTISQLAAEKAEVEKVAEQVAEEERKEICQANLEAAKALVELVEKGFVEGLILIGRNPQSGLFYSDIVFGPNGCPPAQAMSYVGMLELLKLEMSDIAMMAPAITRSGDIEDPHIEVIYEGDGE